MTLIALILVLVAAWVLGRIGWRRTGRTLGILVVVAFLAIGCGVVPSWMLSQLQAGLSAKIPAMHDTGHTVIIVLGGGTDLDSEDDELRVPAQVDGRVTKTVELYRACGSDCRVIVSGGNPQGHQQSEAAVYGRELIALGVDPKSLILEGRSLNTWQNAQFTAKLLPLQTTQTLLVTSGVHLRRSRLYFARFGIHATPVRADFERARLSPIPLGANFMLADAAIHEYMGIALFYVYEAFGWNNMTAKGPGAL
ncbi:MAG TPA: YdcF family protein [Steroidobacteraceae bacterium]|jgi:uncharacterized SAM-binding protein YcdF (DUF218 family)